jgi:hypothetical protein
MLTGDFIKMESVKFATEEITKRKSLIARMLKSQIDQKACVKGATETN